MQLRSRTITGTNDDQGPKLSTRTNSSAPVSTHKTSKPHTRNNTRPMGGDESHDDIVPLSENGVRHAIRYADHYMESNNTSLHAHFIADGKRLYRRWKECDITTRSGANSKLMMQSDFEAFVRFVQNEAGVDITEDVK